MTPTLDAFVVHARKFGIECVYETATEYLDGHQLVELRVELAQIQHGGKGRHPKVGHGRRRPTTRNLREEVAALSSRGLLVAAIADALNISDRRVKQIMSETCENGGRKPADRAKNFADTTDGHISGHPAGEPAQQSRYAVGEQFVLEVPIPA